MFPPVNLSEPDLLIWVYVILPHFLATLSAKAEYIVVVFYLDFWHFGAEETAHVESITLPVWEYFWISMQGMEGASIIREIAE